MLLHLSHLRQQMSLWVLDKKYTELKLQLTADRCLSYFLYDTQTSLTIVEKALAVLLYC